MNPNAPIPESRPRASIREIFLAAREMTDVAQRDQYLNEMSADDPSLRGRVELMISSQQDSQPGPLTRAIELLDLTAFDSADHSTIGVSEHPQIGPYTIREQIGEGGMGTVYVAEQKKPVRRKVALKIIRAGMAPKEIVARFEAERQALAMMDHPNIARVTDGGTTPTGQPYFAMELVQGVPITKYADAHRMSIDERLEMFVKVCQAVQHAHRKGVIHRDLKPSNVLVARIDDRAVPKVIDFGLAKAISQPLTEATVYTGFSRMMGTPMYISPEQAEMGVVDVDTRCDVYALGVMLYELLTGDPPFCRETFKSASFDEIRRIIREVEPMRPSFAVSTLVAERQTTIADPRRIEFRKLRDSLHGELDWIVMKSLEKDRSRRYESASALASDIERYLHNEPVEACPPTIGYRFAKFTRRNRAFIGTVALVMMSLVAGLIGTSWQAVMATQERNRAILAEQKAEQESKRATQAEQESLAEKAQSERNLEAALVAMDKMLTHASDPELKELPLAEVIRNRILLDALAFYEQFKTTSGDSPEVRFRATMVRVEIAAADDHVSNEVLDRKVVLQIFEEATRELESLVNSYPKVVKYRLGLSQTIGSHAWRLMWIQGGGGSVQQRREQGIKYYEREREEYGRLVELDPENAEAYQPLVYDERLKLAAARMASERPDHTPQATALVPEAYVRLIDVDEAQHWDSRGHFFSADGSTPGPKLQKFIP